MKPYTTNPYTRERSERLQRNYLESNSIGLGVMSFGHAILGLVYGDTMVTLYFGAFIVFGFGYGMFFKNLSHNRYVLIGEFLIVSGVVASQFVLPAGAASAVLLFPLGVTLMVFSQTLLRGCIVFAIGLLLFFSFPLFGFAVYGSNLIPEILSYCATFLYSGIVLTFQINKARSSVEFALNRLVETEEELNTKEEALKQYEKILSELNVELDSSNDVLLKTLAKKSETNAVLEQERSNQEELTKAIHRDLKEPLQRIVSASEELSIRFRKIPEAKPVESYLGFAVDGANRMKAMLDDLLEYTKGNDAQELEEVDLNVVATSLRRDLTNLFERSGATVNIGKLPVVRGYSTQLVQLFQNLLSNALKFSRPGVPPEVSIFAPRVQDKPGRFMVRVRDNGIGIPANQIEGIFGLFNRAHAEDGYEGSGVGLALCRRIALAHDAELTVASVYGEGSQFTISFSSSAILRESSGNNNTDVLDLQNTNHHE